jgi:hypothetical protein
LLDDFKKLEYWITNDQRKPKLKKA